MVSLGSAIDRVLTEPEVVARSVVDPDVQLYYRFERDTAVGDKYLCVVVNVLRNDAFVVTAYLTDKIKQGERILARDRVKIWYDHEADYLEVLFEEGAGYFRETSSVNVMEKVDSAGNLLGFSVIKVSSLRREPLEVAL